MWNGENGMVIEAERVLEAVACENPLDDMSDRDVVDYVYGKGYELEVFKKVLGIYGEVVWDETDAWDALNALVEGHLSRGFTRWAEHTFAPACREYINNSDVLLCELKDEMKRRYVD